MSDNTFKHIRFSTDEDISNTPSAFTLPGRMAKRLAQIETARFLDRQIRLKRSREQDPFGPTPGQLLSRASPKR